MPTKPPAGKGKKLPLWAYIAAAGIGVLIVYFLFRSKSAGGTTVPVTTQTPDNAAGTDTGSTADQAFFSQLLALLGASGAGLNNGDGTGGMGEPAGNGDALNNGDTDPAHGPIPSGLPAHPHPPTEKGHCTAPSAPDGTTYACSWCQSGQAIKKNGGVDVCA